MKVSIITVCYNSADTIEATLLSVLGQDYKDIEYIVVDGGSTDGTLDILKKYASRITRQVSGRDGGMYFALNRGIEMATGELIGFLHADDIYPDCTIIASVVHSIGTADTLYGDLQYVARINTEKVIRNWKSQPYRPDLFLKGWMPPHPTFFVRREVYKKYGGFNTTLSISADYELMLRLLHRHRVSAVYLPKVLVKMRTGGISNAGFASRIKANREDRLAWKINGLKPGWLTLIRKPLSKIRQFF